MNGRKRKIQIKFYVTEEERTLIEQKMKLVPTRNMAAYLRKIAIDGYIIQTDHSDIKAMTAEIQKIGVNINQIAKRVNATGSVYQEDMYYAALYPLEKRPVPGSSTSRTGGKTTKAVCPPGQGLPPLSVKSVCLCQNRSDKKRCSVSLWLQGKR